MLRSILHGVPQGVRELGVGLVSLAALDGASNRVGDDTTIFGFDEKLRGGTDKVHFAATVKVEKVRAGIDGAEVAVDIERMKGSGAGDALGWHGLDDVAARDMGFQFCDVGFVTRLTDIGGVFLICNYRRLVRQRDVRREQDRYCGGEYVAGGVVGCGEGERVGGAGNMKVCYHFYKLVEVVKSDNSIEEHEESLRDLQDILHRSGCARFKVSHTVVSDIANRSASQRRESEAWDCCFSVLR